MIYSWSEDELLGELIPQEGVRASCVCLIGVVLSQTDRSLLSGFGFQGVYIQKGGSSFMCLIDFPMGYVPASKDLFFYSIDSDQILCGGLIYSRSIDEFGVNSSRKMGLRVI